MLPVVRDGPLMAIRAQALCTGQRITEEKFTGNAGVKFASAHYNSQNGFAIFRVKNNTFYLLLSAWMIFLYTVFRE